MWITLPALWAICSGRFSTGKIIRYRETHITFGKGLLILFKKKTEDNAAVETKTASAQAPEEAAKAEETKPAEETKAPETVDVGALQKALSAAQAETEKVKAELAQLTDIRLRLAAEYDNFRKRSQREKDAIYTDATAAGVMALLPVIDNIERALAVENASAEDMRKGVEMIGTQAAQAFEKLGVAAFGAVGDAFNPNMHHCVATVAAEGVESGAIALVLQKGYKLGDKVIRPAMVQVAE